MVLCEICKEEFTSSSDIESLLCGHIFHEECLNNWFQTKGSHNCPNCRKTFEKDVPHRHRLYVHFVDKSVLSEEEHHKKKIDRLTEENESLGSLCKSLEESIEDHKEEITSLRKLCKSLEQTIQENNEIIKALQ